MGQVNNLEVTASENDKSYTNNRDEILVVEEDIFLQDKKTELDKWKKTIYLKRRKMNIRNAYQQGGCVFLRRHRRAVYPKLNLLQEALKKLTLKNFLKTHPHAPQNP
ncbi:hypothetical protein ATANTOWER_022342 [Ataeniobius toweri]|uniref:Uncharacterized protein n=1 Tax=Ataeniobius toweri TaxID=208326 RepID=A0ABU7BSZ9_9TELE|nr:hypothetical protein [Ataeniobius toweri]